MKLKLAALALLLSSTSLLALTPTANATHCDENDPVCLPHSVKVCVDNRCFIVIRRPNLPTCHVDLNTLDVYCYP